MTFDTRTLTKIPLFEGLTEKQITDVMPCLGAVIKGYKKNNIIFLEGDKANIFGVVLYGSVRAEKEDYNGNRSVINVIEKYNLFGEAYSFSGIESFPVSMVAAEDCSVMLIESVRIHSSCINSCDIHRLLFRNLLKIVSRKNLVLSRKIEFMSKRTTKEKLMSYLFAESEQAGSKSFKIPFDRQELADFLGVERSAMSAEIGKLRDEGIIEVDRSNFKILKYQ